MMKFAVLFFLVGIATASVLPLVSQQRAVIVHQPHHYGHHYGYGHGYGNGISARYFDQVTYPEYGIYRPVGVHYGGLYHNGLGLGLGYGRLGLGYGYYA